MITISIQQQITMLTRIVEMQGKRICSLEQALAYRGSKVEVETPAPLATMLDIATAHATANGITLEHIRSKDRHVRVSWPRQDAMSAMVGAGFSRSAVGRFFGRDRTTVSHAVAAVKARAG